MTDWRSQERCLPAIDLAALRFVEIGAAPLLKSSFPDQTTFFSTFIGASNDDPAAGNYAVSSRTITKFWRTVRDPGVSLVLCHPTSFSPWHWRWIIRVLFNRRILQGHMSFLRALGPQVLRAPVPARVAILDMDDLPVINRNNFFLLDRADIYFKRELPADHWRLFLKTAHPNLPTIRFRRQKRFAARISKVQPISLGLPLDRFYLLPVESPEKTTDVFFSGNVAGSSTVRARGISELMSLREKGLIVDIPQTPLAPAEFYQRCARAWLVWSPEGLGWDCFRHYEALACSSVPVINHPSIERYRPLIAGEHAFYYDVEPGGLSRAITSALNDKARLSRMAEAGRTHVLAHHTPAAIARHIVETTLAIGGATKE
jgi:hypothetical protein